MLTIISHCHKCSNTIEFKIRGAETDFTLRRLRNAARKSSREFSRLFKGSICGDFHPIETKLKRGDS